MKYLKSMNSKVLTASMTLAGVAVLGTGCAERQVAYVPVYQAPPAYVVQQPAPPPVAYQVQPPPVQPPTTAAPAAPTADWSAPPAAPAPTVVQAPRPRRQSLWPLRPHLRFGSRSSPSLLLPIMLGHRAIGLGTAAGYGLVADGSFGLGLRPSGWAATGHDTAAATCGSAAAGASP